MNGESTPTEADEESLDFEEESTEDTGIRKLVKFLESQNRRPARHSQPAWRRVEQYLEEKRNRRELADSFDLDLEDDEPQP